LKDHHNCSHLLKSLSEYIDGAISQELCAEIDRHLEDCDNCRIVVDSLRKTVYLYKVSAQETEMPEDVRQRLFHRLDLDEFLNNTT